MLPARILIADDHDDTRELLRLMLEAAGHIVRETSNGRECVELALSDPPDLTLLDLSMPLLDGWDALKELRADERRAVHRRHRLRRRSGSPARPRRRLRRLSSQTLPLERPV